jgi:hypothetical protein
MCQPFGTDVTTACRLPHAKAITTGQIMLYLENLNKAQSCKMSLPKIGALVWGVLCRCEATARIY